jgi:predicted nucleic acid-binding protein
MAYLLDSDIVIAQLAGDAATINFVRSLYARGVSISVVTYVEVLEGVLLSSDSSNSRREFERLLADWPVLPLSIQIADVCAELRAGLHARGRRVRTRALDLLIAATALQFGLTLVTRNQRDYADIDALTILIPPTASNS